VLQASILLERGSIMIGRNESFSRTFMCLSFATAALLAFVRLQGVLAQSTQKKIAESPAFTSSFIAFPDRPPQASQSGNSGASSQAIALLPGLGLNLQTALNPNPLAKRSGLIVDLSDRQVSLFQDGTQVASYEIAIGQAGWETPTGQFKVMNLQSDPMWQHPFTGEVFPPGEANPLGSRWIGFWTDGKHQIGLHGTNQDDLIGQAVSHGCIRMRDADIQTLYNQVAIGTSILIRP
jgi:lipoprotein-anchoring transpeptidase ErfK/SrfK